MGLVPCDGLVLGRDPGLVPVDGLVLGRVLGLVLGLELGRLGRVLGFEEGLELGLLGRELGLELGLELGRELGLLLGEGLLIEGVRPADGLDREAPPREPPPREAPPRDPPPPRPPRADSSSREALKVSAKLQSSTKDLELNFFILDSCI